MLPTKFIVFDTETNGIDFEKNEIIEFSYIVVENGEITETFDEVLKPEGDVEQFTHAYTGISKEELDLGLDPNEVLSKFYNDNKDVLVIGHNIDFDIKMVQKYFPEYNPPKLDTQKIAEILWPSMSSYSLENLSHSFEIEKEGSHRALFDVMTTYKVFLYELEKINQTERNIFKVIHKILSKSESLNNLANLFKKFDESDIGEIQPNELEDNKIIENFHTEDEIIKYLKQSEGKKLLLVNLDIFNMMKDTKDVSGIALPQNVLSFDKIKLLVNTTINSPENFEDEFLISLAKIFHFSSITYYGLKDDISLRGKEDSNIWYKVCEDEVSITNPGIFWERVKKKESNYDIHITTFSNVQQIDESKYEKIFVYPIEAAEREITHTSTIRLSLTELKNDFPTEIARIEAEIEESSKQTSIRENLSIVDKLKEISEKIDNSHESKFYLNRFLPKLESKQWFTYYNRYIDENENTKYYLFSSPIKPYFVFDDFEKVELLSKFELSPNELSLIRHFFGDKEVKHLINYDKANIEIKRDATSYGSGFYTEKLVKYLINDIKNKSGIIYVLSPGGASFSSTFWTMWNSMEETPFNCVAEGVGGKNTNLEKISRLHNDNLLIIGGENLYKNLPNEVREKISDIYYTKIQFPNTFNTYGKHRATEFSNSFLEYSMPHSSLMFKAFLVMARKSNGTYPKIYITDSRVWEKDYGKAILEKFL